MSIFQTGDWIAGKYRVERVLGEGGMGTVFEAFHVDLDRRVAIKVVRRDLAQNEQVVRRLMVEARSAAKIKSEHVAKVLDVGRLDSGAPYIVMEYLEGSDLGKVSETRGPLPVAEAVDYVIQACEAIAEAHSAGIIHRDLKPENLFLSRRSDGSALVKVLDFGISKDTGGAKTGAGLTNPSSALGSPLYMSPEQMQAAPDIDGRTDVYALGAILFELLAARGVFLGDTIPAICAQVLGQPPPPLRSLRSDVPGEIEAVVLRCLDKDRNRRFPDVAAFVNDLVPFAGPLGKLSASRITRVVRSSSSTGTALAQTVGIGSSPARTEPAFVSPTGTGTTPAKSNRALLFAGLGAIVLLGGALVVYRSLSPSASAGPEPSSGASDPLLPVPAAAAPATARAPEVTPIVAASAEALAASAADAGTATAPDAGAATVNRTSGALEPSRSPSSRPGAPTPKKDQPKVDAFDPNSFGDRH